MHDPQYYLLWDKRIHDFTPKKRVANCQKIPNTNTFSTVLHITTSKEKTDSEDGKQTERRKLQSAVVPLLETCRYLTGHLSQAIHNLRRWYQNLMSVSCLPGISTKLPLVFSASVHDKPLHNSLPQEWIWQVLNIPKFPDFSTGMCNMAAGSLCRAVTMALLAHTAGELGC